MEIGGEIRTKIQWRRKKEDGRRNKGDGRNEKVMEDGIRNMGERRAKIQGRTRRSNRVVNKNYRGKVTRKNAGIMKEGQRND